MRTSANSAIRWAQHQQRPETGHPGEAAAALPGASPLTSCIWPSRWHPDLMADIPWVPGAQVKAEQARAVRNVADRKAWHGPMSSISWRADLKPHPAQNIAHVPITHVPCLVPPDA